MHLRGAVDHIAGAHMAVIRLHIEGSKAVFHLCDVKESVTLGEEIAKHRIGRINIGKSHSLFQQNYLGVSRQSSGNKFA